MEEAEELHQAKEKLLEQEPKMSMEEALEADGEKLRQLTGEDHGPFELPADRPRAAQEGEVEWGVETYAPEEAVIIKDEFDLAPEGNLEESPSRPGRDRRF
jgi:hypothetical protein